MGFEMTSLHSYSLIAMYTANFYRELQGFYRDLWEQGFSNYRDYRYPAFPVLVYSDFP